MSELIRARISKDPKELEKLAFCVNPEVRLAVARNQHTSPETLNILCCETNYRMRIAIAQNINSPEQALLYLGVEIGNPQIAKLVAMNYSATERVLSEMAYYWGERHKLSILKKITTHPKANDKTTEFCKLCEMLSN